MYFYSQKLMANKRHTCVNHVNLTLFSLWKEWEKKMLKKRKHFQQLHLVSIFFFFKDNRAKLNLLNARFSITSPAYDNFGLGCSCNTSREYTCISLLPAEPRYLKETNRRNYCNAAEQTSTHTCARTQNKLTIAMLKKKLARTQEWTHTNMNS